MVWVIFLVLRLGLGLGFGLRFGLLFGFGLKVRGSVMVRVNVWS